MCSSDEKNYYEKYNTREKNTNYAGPTKFFESGNGTCTAEYCKWLPRTVRYGVRSQKLSGIEWIIIQHIRFIVVILLVTHNRFPLNP